MSTRSHSQLPSTSRSGDLPRGVYMRRRVVAAGLAALLATGLVKGGAISAIGLGGNSSNANGSEPAPQTPSDANGATISFQQLREDPTKVKVTLPVSEVAQDGAEAFGQTVNPGLYEGPQSNSTSATNLDNVIAPNSGNIISAGLENKPSNVVSTTPYSTTENPAIATVTEYVPFVEDAQSTSLPAPSKK